MKPEVCTQMQNQLIQNQKNPISLQIHSLVLDEHENTKAKSNKSYLQACYGPKLYFSIKHMKRIQLSVVTDRLLQGTPSFAIEEKCPQRMILLTTAEQAVWEHGLQKQNCREIHNTTHPQETPISTQNQGRVKQAVSDNAAKLQFPFCRQT